MRLLSVVGNRPQFIKSAPLSVALREAEIVEVVGDVMADASLRFAPIARERSDALRRFGVAPCEFVLVTLHRVANVQRDRLRRIVEGLNSVDDPLVFPAHPRTREALADLEP